MPPKEIALLLAAMDEELAKLASSEEGVVAATLEEPKTLEDQADELEQAGGLESILKLMESAQQNSRRFRPPGAPDPDEPKDTPDPPSDK